jgi:predicted aldo/keto reductase-like oxidoreductase
MKGMDIKMQYVDYAGMKVSRFGLGCMRFPKEEKEAIEMVRYALDNGINYLDTAYVYGNSEVITGKALKDGYRDKAILATKNPIWNITKHDDFEKFLDEELKRLNTEYIDVYLLHNLYLGNWEKVIKYDGLSFLDKMVKKGKIRHKAFSYHGDLKLFKNIVDHYNWEMAQIQLNILDEYNQAGIEGLNYAANKGITTVIMEPLRGGQVINNCPNEAKELIENFKDKRSLADWAFRWLYNKKEVSVVISGTSTLEQLKENIKIFEEADYNVMSKEEELLIKSIQEEFFKKKSINCTGCRYCMPCPTGVDIPEIFKLYNNNKIMESFADKLVYKSALIPEKRDASNCIECGKCEKMCPQEIKIIDNLKKAHEVFMKD